MSNELAQYAPAELVPTHEPDVSDKALERIEKQARTMVAAHQLGSALAKTAMVPEIYQQFPPGKKENETAADNATAAILYGAELGFSAVQSLQNIFIVRGKPAIYSRAMVAQVISAGHQVWEVEATPESVTWQGRRADTGAEFTSTWTIERARKAGFLTNKLYDSIPTEMLRAKCQAEVCRTMAPDVLLGMSHSVEDLQSSAPIVQATAERVPAGPKRGTAGLAERLGVETASDSVAKPDTPQASEADEDPTKPTKEQLEHLNALLEAEKLTTKKAKLDYLEAQYGRKFASATDLKFDEAQDMIDFLAREQTADEAKATDQ